MRKWYQKAALAVVGLFAANFAAAAPLAAIVVTDAVGTLENQIVPITTIATAVLGIMFVVKAFKLIRSAAS